MTEPRTPLLLHLLAAAVALALVLQPAACAQEPDGHDHEEHAEHDHAEHAEHDHAEHEGHDHDEAPGLDIPATVRRNLGLTFARIERRAVRRTLRIPGQFELRPEARRDYHAMVPGRVTLLVQQYQQVAAGTPLVWLDSPEWRRMQHEISESLSAIELAEAELEVARASEVETREAAELLAARVEELGQAGVRKIELESELATQRNRLRRLEAELGARRIAVTTARNHASVTMSVAASVTGRSVEELRETVDSPQGEIPRWQAIAVIEVLAEAAGIVDTFEVTAGGWAETGEELLTTVDPGLLRFRAQALQGDMGKLANGQDALIVPPQGGSIDLQDSIGCKLWVGFRGQPDQRTLPIFATPEHMPAWARPGITGFLEVVIGGGDEETLAIPRSCVMRDGLNDVFFLRDPDDPDRALRIEAELGASDGRWIAIGNELREGDEVVLDGAYELKLATSASATQGGHFHADGTFHDGEDE